MANERTYAILPCRALDESITFYELLGFTRTYRQLRPNPYAVVALEDIQIHLCEIEGFTPNDSYASVIIAVPDPDGLYHTFAVRLRGAYGRLPVAGIPRILRPRKRYGTVRGFTVIDPGGNWLRVYQLGESEQEAGETGGGLAHILLVAARLGDAKGDASRALTTLDNGLKRFLQAAPSERVQAYLYRTELAVRLSNPALARESWMAALAIGLSDAEQAQVADELAHVSELMQHV